MDNITKITKPNDWFVVNAVEPNATLDDLKQMAVSPENTGLNTKSYYEQLPTVQNLFKNPNTGDFDNVAFENYYNNLVKTYNTFSTQQYSLNKFTDNLLYSEYNFLGPPQAKTKDYKIGITKIFNPTSSQIGIEGFGIWSESPLSLREVAQTQEVKNQKGESLGFTPNDDDKSGIIDFYWDKFFGTKDTLALAQWTEDGTHIDPFSGSSIPHKKGDMRYNEYGKPYYETLEGKTPANRQILSPWDTITVDGSTQNAWDFMDSDGKNKNIIGTIMKSAAFITPYFILGLGQYYALATAGLTATRFLPQLGKMIGGFMEGEEFKKSDLYKSLNKIESFAAATINNTVSDNSMDKIWTWENLFTMVPEIFIQLKQQTALAKLPEILKLQHADTKQLKYIADKRGPSAVEEVKDLWKKAKLAKAPEEGAMMKQLALLKQDDPELFQLYQGWVNTQNKISKGLAIGYMTAASSGDVEQIVDQFDIGARDAQWMKLGVLAAFWIEMNTWSLGDWQVDYAVGLDDTAKYFKKVLKEKGKTIKKDFDALELAGGVTPSTVVEKGFFEKLRGLSSSEYFKKGKELGSRLIEKIDGSRIQTAMAKEAIEEMSEETFIDGAKIVYNIFYDLNLTTNKERKINWDNDQTLSRYILAGIGGALGGVLFHANQTVTSPIRKEVMTDDFAHIAINMFKNGQGGELYKAIDNIQKSKDGFASKNLSFSIFDSEIQKDGSLKRIFEPQSESALSQNDVIANTLTESLKLIEKAIFQAGIPSQQKTQDVFSQRTNSFFDVKEHTAIEDDINKLTKDYIKLYAELQDTNKTLETNKNDPAAEKRAKELFLEMQTKQKQIEETQSEKGMAEYYQEAMFNMDKRLHNRYIVNVDVETYAQAMYNGKSYSELNDTQKSIVDSSITNLSKREKLRIAKKLFDADAKLIRNTVMQVNEFMSLRKDIRQDLDKIEFNYFQEVKDPNTDLSRQTPAFGKKGISEFLNIRNTLNNPEKLQLSEEFYIQINEILDRYNSNPQSITNDEYLLLKELVRLLSQQEVKDEYYGLDESILDYIKEISPKHNLIIEDILDTGGFSIDLKRQLQDRNTKYEAVDFINDNPNIAWQSGKEPFGFRHQYQLKTGNLYQIQFEKQLNLFEKLLQQNLEKSDSLSALEEFLKKLNIQYKSDPTNILNLIDQERSRLLEKPLEEYIQQSEITLKEIEKAIELLDRLKVVLSQYTNFSSDPNTAIGYFPALNEYNKKNNILDVYSQLDIENQLPLRRYINYVTSRLFYLKSLSIKNINSKIPNKEKSELVMSILQFRNFLKKISNINAFDELVQKSYEDQDFQNYFKLNVDLKDLEEELNSFTIEELKNVHLKIYKFEHEVFNITVEQKDKTEFQNIILDVFLNESTAKILIDEIINEQFTEYQKQTIKIKELDQLFYQLSIFTGDSYKFLDGFNEIYTNEKIEYALFGDQQNQLKQVHHFIQNKNKEQFGITEALDIDLFFKEVIARLRIDSQDLTPLVKLDEFFLTNIFSIYGVQGTGKTYMLDFIGKLCKQQNINLIVTADTENIREKVKKCY